ncbi:MAG: phosphotransferase [Gemmatimonadaceae bacterium]
MLASPDRELAERHPQLPGLGLVFDTTALAKAARRCGVELPRDCEPTYVRFKPGTRCLVGYGSSRSHGSPLFYASAFERGSAKLTKASKRAVVETSHGPGRIVLDEHAVELCVFPNDDHLEVLISLANSETRGAVIARLLPATNFMTASQLDVVAYKPERRCVFKYNGGDGTTALIKAYEQNAFSAARKRALHFCSKPRLSGTQRLIGADESARLLAMNWLPGRSLAEEIRLPSPNLSHTDRAGRRLAEIHASEPDGLPEWSHSGAAGRLHEIAAVFGVLLPPLFDRMLEVSSRVMAALNDVNGASVVSHGDFHTEQILIDGDRIALIDFDEALMAPPAFDIGSFISRLQMNAARGEISERVSEDAAESFVEGYAANRAAPSKREILAFTALALLNVAQEPFRRRRAEWPSEIVAILDRTEKLLGAIS